MFLLVQLVASLLDPLRLFLAGFFVLLILRLGAKQIIAIILAAILTTLVGEIGLHMIQYTRSLEHSLTIAPIALTAAALHAWLVSFVKHKLSERKRNRLTNSNE